MLARGEVSAKIVELNKVPNGRQMKRALLEITGQRTVPNIFIGGEHIGGSDVLAKMAKSGLLSEKLTTVGVQFREDWWWGAEKTTTVPFIALLTYILH